MASEDFHDSPLAKALRRRKELQDAIREAVQEIKKIEEFLKMYRDLSTGPTDSDKGATGATPELSMAAWGQTQAVFENQVLGVLRDVGRPMKSGEIVEEFRRRGHPIPGNEVRTAWNRLWKARSRGVLTNDVKLGYWISGEPLSERAKQEAALAPRRRLSIPADRNKGKKKGRAPILTPEQVEAGEKMLLAGKSRIEVAAALGGVSQGTIQTYFPGGIAGLKKKYPDVVIPKRTYRPRPGRKGHGRPPIFNMEQARQIADMKAQGKRANEIAEIMGVKRTTIYKYLKKAAASE